MRLQVKNFMTSMVLTTDINTTVSEIRDMMKRNGVHAIPITEHFPNGDWQIKGIVTATDLCRKVNDSLPVHEVMNDCRVHVIPPNMGAKAAAKNMLKHKVHHLVVMEDGKIIGMLSSQDFVKLVSEFILEPKTAV